MSRVNGSMVDRYVDRYVLDAFEKIDNNREESKPSEVEEYLEAAWGLGEMWREWWEESGEEYF